MNENIINSMREIEPNYNDWSNQDINNQIDAILEGGQEWVEDNNGCGFKHKEFNIYLNIPNLNFYSPEQIKDTYKRVWSKNFDGVKASGYLSKSIGLLIHALMLGFIFLSTNKDLILNGIILSYIMCNYIQFRIFSKKKIVLKI